MATFCSKCGAEIPIGEGFCPKCGNMISVSGNTASSINVNNMNKGNKKQSVVGITAGALGIAGVLLAFFGIGVFLGIAALVLGIIGIAKKQEYKIGMAVTGIVTGGICVFVGIILIIALAMEAGREEGYNDGYNSGFDSGFDSGYDVPWYEKW